MLEPRWSVGLFALTVSLAVAALCTHAETGTHADSGTRAENGASTLEPLHYDRDIRPILSDRCFRCHGPDPAKRQAKMRLDVFDDATADRGGHAAIVPGHALESELWSRITSRDAEERMPPATSNRKSLSADECALVKRWIDEGAHYEPHWSFVAPERPGVPEVHDASWPKNQIDRFLLARLERESIAPSPDADRATLLRRVFLDLTGLPPTPEELDAFLADARPDAFERWVDRLLHEEPYVTRYAERMATPWLDAARYADTCGIHMDAGRSIWLWRDWVLAAYREGMPFDRFLTEQLAGDLLPNASEAQKIASGFNRNHVTSDEGGAINEEYLVEYAVDRAATTSSVFLGLTMGCARCHEHKFDPISQEDFYRFFAYFDSIEEPGVYLQSADAKRALEPFLAVASPEQKAALAGLQKQIAHEKQALDEPIPGEEAERAKFFAERVQSAGVEWAATKVVKAESTGGATLAIEADGAVFASGKNPDKDDHILTLRTDVREARLVAIEALADARLPSGRVGRAPNGNAVLSGVEAEAISVADPKQRQTLHFTWAWADREQANGDFNAVNVLDHGDLGWAVDAHNVTGPRAAILFADEPFGFAGGTELAVRLEYRSMYTQHTFGRTRLRIGTISAAGLDALPTAVSRWYLVGPFPADSGATAFSKAFGPEATKSFDPKQVFGAEKLGWSFAEGIVDGVLDNALPEGTNVSYVGRRLYAPAARKIDVSFGTDDGFRLFLDGREIAAKQIDRSLSADQEQLTLDVPAGTHFVVCKIVNTGGKAGFTWRSLRRAEELAGDLAAMFLPADARWPELEKRVGAAWRLVFSPSYRVHVDGIAALEKQSTELDAAIPRTMVMSELAKPRETFVLTRGQYDHPDKTRPVQRGVPAALGRIPDGAPTDRRGLAQWMIAPENPLVARVAVNRMWEQVFGTGLVRTSEDFGHQGEWPSHPELLDWLALQFRESGWDVKALMKLLVTSRAYRQSSRLRPELGEKDPENRLLAFFPRKRLGAEQIRDQALYVSGLLVEKTGGPSVKSYQPAGLWPEVAMLQSNTHDYVMGKGPELWRRSLYTYWKRACPPPAMTTFDAPTRESCTIRRSTTNTPLQALVLWNDVQFVEAARTLAQRTLAETSDDHERLTRMFRRCTGRAPHASELEHLVDALAGFRERFANAAGDAEKLIATSVMSGESMAAMPAPAVAAAAPAAMSESPLGVAASVAPKRDARELAAWTLIANALLNLDSTITRS